MSIEMRFPKVLLTFLLFLCSHSLLAQSTNGKISGLVLDQTRGVISGADVLVANDVTGVKTVTTTNAEGIYVFASLPPGPYRLQVSKIGFKTLIKPDIVLDVQGAISINFTLPIGAVSDSVTVEGGASLLNAADATVSTVVDQTYIANMPLNGRSFQDLILLTPGVVTQSPQLGASGSLGIRGEFSVNGQRPESNYDTVDGVSANVGVSNGDNTTRAGPSGSLAASTALGTTQALVSVDDLQEFRVQSSTYSAEYGRNPGGQFAFETKSGTNEWHGTGFDYLRNGFFDAQDWFSDYFGVKQPALRQNDFGGTLGGPLEIPGLYNGRNKTFFFFSYEGLRLTAPQAAVATPVPDLCWRGTGPCPSGRQPAPAALQPVFNAFPLPSPTGLVNTSNGVAQFIGSWSNINSLDSTSLRFDHTLNDKVKVFFRFSDTPSDSTLRRPASTEPASLIQDSAYSLRTYTAGINQLITNRFVNEFRINHSSNGVSVLTDISPFGGSSPLNLFQLTGLPSTSFLNVGFLLGPSAPFLVVGQSEAKAEQRQWNFVDTFSASFGRHQLKVGEDYRQLTPSTGLSTATVVNAAYLYFTGGAVTSNTSSLSLSSRAPAYPLYRSFSAFVQDEWKISGRLNLSAGLRWEVNPAPGAAQGLKAYTLVGSGPNNWALAPQGTTLWRTTWYNVAPRLGAAYVLGNRLTYETVIRGGAGVFFDTGQQLGSVSFDGGPGFQALLSKSSPFPGNLAALVPPIVIPPVPPFGSVNFTAPHLQLPYTIQWSTSIEQELGKSQVLSIFYVGAHSSRLLRLTEFPGSAQSIASLFRIVQNGLTSDYDSLQLQFQRRLNRGLTALGSYTWSHCLDYGSQNYTYGYLRGNCDFDVRHNLSTAFSYTLPRLTHGTLAKMLLNNWGIDDRFTARTGFPVTLNGPTLLQSDGSRYFAGLNLVPGQSLYLYGSDCDLKLQTLGDLRPGSRCPGGRAINPLAFANVSTGFGNAPRNFARGFGAWQMNLALRREFLIYERLKLNVRAEAFNIFNHPNFGAINPGFGQTTFGQATSTLANSLGVVSPLYQPGGPRSMQFALRLVF